MFDVGVASFLGSGLANDFIQTTSSLLYAEEPLSIAMLKTSCFGEVFFALAVDVPTLVNFLNRHVPKAYPPVLPVPPILSPSPTC